MEKHLELRTEETKANFKKEAIITCRKTREFTERTYHQSTLFCTIVNDIYITLDTALTNSFENGKREV